MNLKCPGCFDILDEQFKCGLADVTAHGSWRQIRSQLERQKTFLRRARYLHRLGIAEILVGFIGRSLRVIRQCRLLCESEARKQNDNKRSYGEQPKPSWKNQSGISWIYDPVKHASPPSSATPSLVPGDSS